MSGKSVGIVGARGIGNYGGYERMLVDLVPRLVQKGYDIRCSCEQPDDEEGTANYKGAKLDYFPLQPPANYTLRKAYELLYDSYFIMTYSLVCDIVYVLGIYGGLSLLIPRVLGKEVIVNTDGLEWKRAKYNVVEQGLIVLFFVISINLASRIIVDNEQLKQFIGERHHFKTSYVPYGVSQQKQQPWDEPKLTKYVREYWDETKLSSYVNENAASGKVREGEYWLVVARLEPENNIDVIIDGFVKARPNYPLVIVGDFTSGKYRDRVYTLAFNGNTASIFFLGAIYDAGLLGMLRQYCFAYIHGHSVGGTNPSLLEAMICENLIVSHDNVFNRELCGRYAHYFSNSADFSDLVSKLEMSAGKSSEFGSEVYKRAIAGYSWDSVLASHEEVLRGDICPMPRTERETEA